MINRLRMVWCQARDSVPMIVRLMVTGDVGRFERESGEFRARYGIGQD